MSIQFEIRKYINDIHDALDRCEIQIIDSHGWLQLAVQIRQLLSSLEKAEQACDVDDLKEAVGWIKSAQNEFAELADEAAQAEKKLKLMDKGFAGAACWLWTERQFAVPYDDGCCDGYACWFDGYATLVELETTLQPIASTPTRSRHLSGAGSSTESFGFMSRTCFRCFNLLM